MPEQTQLIKFAQSKPAYLLQAYCNKHGIKTSVLKDVDGFNLVLMDDSQLSKALQVTKEFLAEPQSSKFQQAAWESGEISTEKSPLLGSLKIDMLTNWSRQWLTILVTISCVVLFLLMKIGFGNEIFAALKIQYFVQLYENNEWYRLFGPNFMHGSATHLVFNLLWWWILGGQIERILGSFSLFTIFIVASLAANLSQLLVSGPNFLGLSGVVYALFGFVWWIGRLRPTWGLSVSNTLVVILLLWLVMGYADVLWVNMANQAHTFGLIAGIALAFLMHAVAPVFNKKS